MNSGLSLHPSVAPFSQDWLFIFPEYFVLTYGLINSESDSILLLRKIIIMPTIGYMGRFMPKINTAELSSKSACQSFLRLHLVPDRNNLLKVTVLDF